MYLNEHLRDHGTAHEPKHSPARESVMNSRTIIGHIPSSSRKSLGLKAWHSESKHRHSSYASSHCLRLRQNNHQSPSLNIYSQPNLHPNNTSNPSKCHDQEAAQLLHEVHQADHKPPQLEHQLQLSNNNDLCRLHRPLPLQLKLKLKVGVPVSSARWLAQLRKFNTPSHPIPSHISYLALCHDKVATPFTSHPSIYPPYHSPLTNTSSHPAV